MRIQGKEAQIITVRHKGANFNFRQIQSHISPESSLSFSNNHELSHVDMEFADIYEIESLISMLKQVKDYWQSDFSWKLEHVGKVDI